MAYDVPMIWFDVVRMDVRHQQRGVITQIEIHIFKTTES